MATPDRENLKRQIRDAVNIVDLVGSYVTLRRAGSTHKGLCPFHEEKTPSFTVSELRQTFKCFGCGAGGDVFSFVQLKENIGFPDALRTLADRAGISLEPMAHAGKTGPGKQDLASVNQWAQQFFRQNYIATAVGQSAREYVDRRSISAEMAEVFGIGFALDSYEGLLNKARASGFDPKLLEAAGLVKSNNRGGHYDTFRNRLMFPIIDATGRVIGFGGRTLGDDPAKYLNSPATALFDKSSSLFGLNVARQPMAAAGRAIVVEGYTDCIMAHQFGLTETVATLGTAMTDGHANVLRRYTDRVVLLFDSDQAGQRAADRAISVTLISGLDVTLAKVPQGKDPCDFLLMAGRDSMDRVLKEGLGALEFKWNCVAQEFESSTTGPGRRRAIEAYLQQLAVWLSRGVIDPIQKGLLVNQLGKILSLPTSDLHKQLDVLAQRVRSDMQGASASASAVNKTTATGLPASSGETGGSGGTRGFRPALTNEGLSAVDDDAGPLSAEQRALVQVVEVLLNEPGLWLTVEPYFEPTLIHNRMIAAVAVELVGMLRSGEPFEISELVGRFESPDYGRIITDLEARGEQRARYALTLDGAIACLEDSARQRKTQLVLKDQADANEDEKLLALAELAKNPRFTGLKNRALDL
ncbi:MAG: DNA primase [Phycisphaerae bacterium]|nr:DNA primase [Phycisphaerae bacterium]